MKRCVLALLLLLALGLAPAAVTAHAAHMAAGQAEHGTGHAPAHAMAEGHTADCGDTPACQFGAAACAWVCTAVTGLPPASASDRVAATLRVVHPRSPAILRKGEGPPSAERPPEPVLL